MRRNIWPLIKWASLAVSLGSILLAVVIVIFRQPDQPDHANNDKKPAQTQVSSPLIVEKKGDRMIWRLQAEKAEQQLNGKMHLLAPELTLFTDSGESVPVSSEEAWFNPIQRDITFKRHVRVNFRGWKLSCEDMFYISSKDELLIPGAFDIVGNGIEAKGKHLKLNRGSQQLWVENGIWIRDDNGALPVH